jgi:hypothetical protein
VSGAAVLAVFLPTDVMNHILQHLVGIGGRSSALKLYVQTFCVLQHLCHMAIFTFNSNQTELDVLVLLPLLIIRITQAMPPSLSDCVCRELSASLRAKVASAPCYQYTCHIRQHALSETLRAPGPGGRCS